MEMRTELIKLPVKDVRNGSTTEEGWRCDVTFGIPGDGAHDDPTITVTSEDVGKYPLPGDVMLVYPPRVVGYEGEEMQREDDLRVRDADAVEVFIADCSGQRYSGSNFASIEAAREWLKLQPNRECLRVAVTAKFVLEDDGSSEPDGD